MPAEAAAVPFWQWAAFIGGVLVFVLLDLFVFHRGARPVTFRNALFWTSVTVLMALLFGAALVPWRGKEEALEFVTGYVIELSLSMDNVFVIALIFSYFQVPTAYQHRVLFFGFIDALIMRGTFIALGTVLVSAFHWVLYVMGVVLLFTGVRMLFAKEEGVHPEKNPFIKLARRLFPVTTSYDGAKFFTRIDEPAQTGTVELPRPSAPSSTNTSESQEPLPCGKGHSPTLMVARRGRFALTPLVLVLLMVETTDLVFAIDSIPAIFSVTQKPFIIFTSNIFAILGLRSLYFVLVSALEYFRYLKFGLALVLVFVGLKMLGEKIVHIPSSTSLLIVCSILLVAIVASVLLVKRGPHAVTPVRQPPPG